MLSKLARLVTLFSIVSLLGACQFSESRYLGRDVKPEELFGRWRATQFAMKSMRDVGVRNHLDAQDHRLVLNADSSCSIRAIMNMPPLDKPADYRAYDTGCRWRLDDDKHQTLEFDITPAPALGPPNYYFAEEDGDCCYGNTLPTPMLGDTWSSRRRRLNTGHIADGAERAPRLMPNLCGVPNQP